MRPRKTCCATSAGTARSARPIIGVRRDGVSTREIQNYVWCADCQCSVGFWDTYRWHADQGCRLLWGRNEPPERLHDRLPRRPE
jgi:hypothetical protein